MLVYGNDGPDVIADYTDNEITEKLVAGAAELGESLEGEAQAFGRHTPPGITLTFTDGGRPKSDIVAELYPGQTVDYALPADWVRKVQDRLGVNPVPHFVWLYEGLCGRPAPLTKEGVEILSKLGAGV
ncbi:hypothetical protein D9M69_690990 [compost metagenome]